MGADVFNTMKMRGKRGNNTKYKKIFYYLNIFKNVIYFCNGKAIFFEPITSKMAKNYTHTHPHTHTHIHIHKYMYMGLWTTKTVLSRWGVFVAIANNTIQYGVKIIHFPFMPKIIRLLSKDHVP